MFVPIFYPTFGSTKTQKYYAWAVILWLRNDIVDILNSDMTKIYSNCTTSFVNIIKL